MKDPAFLFYPNDYLGGTMGMTFEQKGAYIELLMTQFNRGHMTTHMIGQVLGQQGGQMWDILKDKFIIDDDGKYFNKRLEEEQKKRRAYTDSRKNNFGGLNQYSKKQGHKGGRMTDHMENRNRNENKEEKRRLKEEMAIGFSNWYFTYPRKESRGDAEKAWIKNYSLMPPIEKMISVLKSQIKVNNWILENKKFIPMPATYLNGKRWEDQI
jgi:uncharacterized protein YdaU (DUF1376 family)